MKEAVFWLCLGLCALGFIAGLLVDSAIRDAMAEPSDAPERTGCADRDHRGQP